MARKKREVEIEETEMADAAEGGGSKVYELGFHLDPELPSEEVKKAYQEIRATVEGQGAVVAEGEPQMTQLAYSISRQEPSGRRDFDSAHFSWIAYETSAPNHAAVLATVAADKRIIRSIDVITDKDAARHAAELREMAKEIPASAPSEPAAAEAELDAALEHVLPAQAGAV
ncbi:30S ribosomal protein S6 [Candidatus Kaiserbacteria bacterium]|nr:30S ribosomal protein S6 [Candidatus Kaiserbacteria bacterium]